MARFSLVVTLGLVFWSLEEAKSEDKVNRKQTKDEDSDNKKQLRGTKDSLIVEDESGEEDFPVSSSSENYLQPWVGSVSGSFGGGGSAASGIDTPDSISSISGQITDGSSSSFDSSSLSVSSPELDNFSNNLDNIASSSEVAGNLDGYFANNPNLPDGTVGFSIGGNFDSNESGEDSIKDFSSGDKDYVRPSNSMPNFSDIIASYIPSSNNFGFSTGNFGNRPGMSFAPQQEDSSDEADEETPSYQVDFTDQIDTSVPLTIDLSPVDTTTGEVVATSIESDIEDDLSGIEVGVEVDPDKDTPDDPVASPTNPPTRSPTKPPSMAPTKAPVTPAPTKTPTKAPSTPAPTKMPTRPPTKSPTRSPTKSPTKAPTKSPTVSPVESGPTFENQVTAQPVEECTVDTTDCFQSWDMLRRAINLYEYSATMAENAFGPADEWCIGDGLGEMGQLFLAMARRSTC